MKISTKSRYGVRACYYMAEHYGQSDNISITDISLGTGISASYLEQLFLPLRRAGIVGAVRGACGGYFLTKQPSEVTIGEIMRAVEDGLELVDCINGECASKENCPSHLVWTKLYLGINSLLDSITLQTMLDGDVR